MQPAGKLGRLMGVEVSFFLIDENRFRHNESGGLGAGVAPPSISAVTNFITAVRLASKRILWNGAVRRKHYDDYVMTLYARGCLL